MASIYKLKGMAAEAEARYNEIEREFEELMDENGGELTEESQEYLDKLEKLNALKAQIKEDILQHPDSYAAWYKNAEARKKVAEAELKAFKESCQIAIAKYEAKVKKADSDMKWIQTDIADAMTYANVESFTKDRSSDAMFSLWFQESKSIEVDEVLALKEYKEKIDKFFATLPAWLPFTLKIDKKVLSKEKKLPTGFERKVTRTLRIQ